MLTTGNKQVRKNRLVASTPLISDANLSLRTAPSRRVQFPPLQFISEGGQTVTKLCVTRSPISGNVAFCDNAAACSKSSYDVQVPNGHIRLEHVEEEVEAETVEHLQSSEHYESASTLAETECQSTIGSHNNHRVELTSCPFMNVKPFRCDIDDTASCNHLSVRTVNDKTLTEKSPNSVLCQNQDLTVYAENASAVNFDINTPSSEIEPSSNSAARQKSVAEMETEADSHQNMSGLAGRNSVEPVRVLSFSRLDGSLDETRDHVERVVCAAELNENMSELVDKEEEISVNEHVDCRQPLLRDRSEFLSALGALTPLETCSDNSVLVSDTPVCDYGLSYRQRALKAGNIRLRHRTHKS